MTLLQVESKPVAESSPAAPKRGGVLALMGAVVLVGVLAYAGTNTHAAPDVGILGMRRTCSTGSLRIKSGSYYMSGSWERAGTTYSGTATYSRSASSWNIEPVSGYYKSASYFYISISGKGSTWYLTYPSGASGFGTSGPALTLSTTRGTNQKWSVEQVAGCATDQVNSRRLFTIGQYGKMIVAGSTAPKTSRSGSRFRIEDAQGNAPCTPCGEWCSEGTAACPVLTCKDGIAVNWYNDTYDEVITDAEQTIKTASETQCTNHCMTCTDADINCRPCGGRIDLSGEPNYESGQVSRNCLCNSAFKAAGLSFASILVTMAALLKLW